MDPQIPASRIRLRPRPDAIFISRGRTVLGTDLQGTIAGKSSRQGLFVYDTRMLSRYRWTLDGRQPQLSTQSPVEQHSWLSYYFQAPRNCKRTPTHDCNPLQQTIELKIARVVGEGLHEDVELTNHTQIHTSVLLQLEVDADFAAHREIQKMRQQKGKLRKQWTKTSSGGWTWKFDYHSQHQFDHQGNTGTARLHRAVTLHLHADSSPSHAGRKISFQIKLAPQQSWKACLIWQPEMEGKLLPVEMECNALSGSMGEYSRKNERFLNQAARVVTTGAADLTHAVQRVIDRSRLDLSALRLFDLDQGEHNWKPAAGIPTYMAVFGRDLLASGWQASLLSNDMTRGALSIIASTQAHERNDWRDAQPGRMLHESHSDPLSVLNFTPQALYYGTVSSLPLFAVCASELLHWTGEKEFVRQFIPHALEAFAWADNYSRNEEGFYTYTTRSKQGMKNQGWKDSSDAIVYPDGSQVQDPLGTCEMQAFMYAAKLHFAETLWWLDETDHAKRFFNEARELKKRFNERFWMDDVGYVAMAIDKDGRVVKTVASDPGHCVLSGILENEFVPRVIQRMLLPDLFSGWGIRTLSSEHPAYNPFAYHRGTVWPVENGSFVLGMARYGQHPEMWQLARVLFEAATLFDYDRLPEVFGGHPRDREHPFPCLYERADSPQAWSASVPFVVLQALLGMYPYAPLNVLFLDPWLPDWLPDVTVEDLRIGGSRLTLRFKRNDEGRTNYTVVSLDGDLHILRQPSPWSLTATWGERFKDAIMSLLPGNRRTA